VNKAQEINQVDEDEGPTFLGKMKEEKYLDFLTL